MKALLLVALYLLTSAATAHAEGAWVLWLQTSSGWTRDVEISPGVATRTLPECETALRQAVTNLGSKGRNTTFNPGAGFVATWSAKPPRPSGEEPMIVQSFSCLPDTVDPRGPKGK